MSLIRIVCVIGLVILGIITIVVVTTLVLGQLRQRQVVKELGPEHPGATLHGPSYAPPRPPPVHHAEPTRLFPRPQPAPSPIPPGRHRAGAVRQVASGWKPPIGAARLRSFEETREMRPEEQW